MKLGLIALRNIRRNKRRSILSITATAVAAMSIVMLFSFKEGIIKDLEYNLKTFYTGEIRIRHKDYDKNEFLNPLHLRIQNYKAIINNLSDYKEIDRISPRINFPAVIYRPEKNHRIMAMGLDFSYEKNFQNIDKLEKEKRLQGRLPEKSLNEVIIGKTLSSDLELKVGDKITIMSSTMRRSINAMTFTISGIMDFPMPAMNKKTIQIPLDRAEYFLRMDNSATEILLKTNGKADIQKLTSEINNLLQKNKQTELLAKAWNKIKTMYSFMEIADIIYNFMALFFFLLASTVIVNTTMMVIYERIAEIGTLGAMGMNKNEIVRLFFLEAAFLGIAGAMAGVAAGIIFTLILSKTGLDFSKAMENMQVEINKIIYPALNFKSTVLVFIYSVSISSLISFIPSSRAAKIKPAEALKK